VTEDGRESLAAPPRIDAILLLVAVTGVSFSGPLIAATVAPALAIAFWRTAIAGGLTIPVVLLRRRAEVRALTGRTLKLSGLAGVALALHFSTWVPSATMTSVASATALVSTQTVFAAVIAHRLGRRLPRLAWIGIAISMVGTVLVTGADFGLSGRAVVGDLLAVLGGLFSAVYVTIGGRARRDISATTYTSICYLVCSVVMVSVCLIGGQRLDGFSTDAWVKIGLITVCAQLLGHSLINIVLRSASATVP
jgi:drug/metabolite transporter (DMT)-like permease